MRGDFRIGERPCADPIIGVDYPLAEELSGRDELLGIKKAELSSQKVFAIATNARSRLFIRFGWSPVFIELIKAVGKIRENRRPCGPIRGFTIRTIR